MAQITGSDVAIVRLGAMTEDYGIITFFAAILAMAWMIFSIPRLRGTTLVAPCLWAIFSALVMACTWLAFGVLASEVFSVGAWQASQTSIFLQSVAKYAAATTTICPMMAVLGAKRPQDRGWKWIVLSLWVMLLLPAMQALLTPNGGRLELFIVWKLFLGILIVLGLVNYLPTKYWLAAVCYAAGQIALLWEYFIDTQSPSWKPTPWGSLLLLATVAFVRVATRRPRATCDLEYKAPHDESARDSLNRLNLRWLAFRNAFGTFWGLRIMQRVNQTAEIRQWPVRLDWSGFVAMDERKAANVNSVQAGEMQTTLQMLLRRFM